MKKLVILLLAAILLTACVTFDMKLKDNLCMQADVASVDGTISGAVQVCPGEKVKDAIAEKFGKLTAYLVTQRGELCEREKCPPLEPEKTPPK